MILRVRHVTAYAYADRVELAAHMLHMRPRSLPHQRVLSCELTASAPVARRTDGKDHFGNAVTWLFLDSGHTAFEVASEAVVDLEAPRVPPPRATPAWEAVAAAARRPEGWQESEFAYPSGMAPALPGARDFAALSFPPGRPVLEGLIDLVARIGRDFRFQRGVTTVSTPVDRVLQLRAGVCQDFAHLMIAGLRGLGLPARYVSGYVRTRPAPGMARMRGADQSHAWVGCWLGPEWGWIDLDPTNNLVVGDEHVTVGWGRDFADVSPLHGIILGGGAHSLRVSVDLEPEAAGQVGLRAAR